MQTENRFSAATFASTKSRQSGVALIVALLLLLLLSGLSIMMVLSTSSDLLTNGYYRGFRGAFYAADSGLNVVRQDMVNQILLAKNANFSITQQAIPASAAATVQNYISSNYGQAFHGVSGAQGQGQASGSWPESFEVTAVYFGVDPTTG